LQSGSRPFGRKSRNKRRFRAPAREGVPQDAARSQLPVLRTRTGDVVLPHLPDSHPRSRSSQFPGDALRPFRRELSFAGCSVSWNSNLCPLALVFTMASSWLASGLAPRMGWSSMSPLSRIPLCF